jgi:NitT/TauT family transport system ATP-binding protein/nitrate/nitrite transport system substrate-binding protein
MSERLRLGFIALNDAASVIAAKALGYFADEGLDVELSREVSWATIRDKVSVGALEGAHMLAPMALATSIGGGGMDPVPLLAPFALNLDGPAVTLAARLAAALELDGRADGLARLVTRRREEGASPITLAVVFPFSVHNYLLRDWLAAAGIDPDRDIRLMIAPPARMTGLLVDGVVEGFCVTEPWDSAAVAAGAGVIAVRSGQLRPRTPDKVFAVTEAWAEQHPDELQALLRALTRAAAWADTPANRGELAGILSQERHVNADSVVIARTLRHLTYHAGGANMPQPVHAGWLLGQMMRWGHIAPETDIAAIARRVYRPDLFATAAASLGLDVPAVAESLAGFGALAEARADAAAAPLSRIAAI